MVSAWLVVSVSAGVVAGSEAFGATGHQFLSSFSEASAGTDLAQPAAVAVDRLTGQAFVGDKLAGYVDVYGPSGEFQMRFGGGVLEPAGIAVDEASGDVYVADPFDEGVLVYEPDGNGGYALLSRWYGRNTPGKEFGEVTGVAVDNSIGPRSGDLYVVEAKAVGVQNAVELFKPKPNPKEGEEGEEGQFLGRLSGGKLEDPNGIVVNRGTGRVLVADSVKGAIFAYSSEGVYEEKLNGKSSPNGVFNPKSEQPGNVAALAVDEASGEIYVAEAERHAVSQYSSKGAWEGWITETPEGALDEPRGLALTSGGDLYVADAGLAVVDLFGPAVVVPDVETGKVAKTTLTRTSAVLSGTINGDGNAAQYSFQYGETPALGSQTQSKSSGTGSASASAEVTGLHAGRTYYYRIVGENENGSNVGVVRSFETLPAVEEVETGPVKELKPEEATLTGTLNPGGIDSHYYFQWGTTSAYGNSIPAPPGTDAGSGTSAIEAETVLTGLSANTLYHYRLVAENEEYGTTYGQDRTFTTSGPPRITYEPGPVSGITQTEATIHAQINPDQLETTYRFQYGETTAYGQETPEGGEAIGSGATPMARSATLTELTVGTTYHYRVLAENQAGITEGPDQTFTTVPPAPVDAIYVTGVGSTEATLHTQINPLGNNTHYYFQYGTQSCEGNPNACTDTPGPPGEDIGEGSEDVAREVALAGLQPDTTYHFRVVASNSLGTSEGPDRMFTTQQEPGFFALPDKRAFELVSPPDKGGAPVEALTREGGIIVAAEDGSALTYVVNGGLGEAAEGNRSPEWQQVLATRGQSAWSSRDIATPNSSPAGATPGNAPEYQFFAPDLSSALVEPVALGTLAEPPLAPGITQATMYLRDNATGMYLALVNDVNTSPGTQYGGAVHFASATPDLSHVVLASKVALTGAGSAPGLYEWTEGALRLASVLPNGKPALASSLGFIGHVVARAVSNDGSRIVWGDKAEGTAPNHLYLRDEPRGETVRLDAAQGVVEPATGVAHFQSASVDGSRIFFTDKQRLTADSTAEAAQGVGRPDLYECEIVEVASKLACSLEDLTVDHNEGEHATVQNFIFGVNEDGSILYLVAQGVLAGNENGNGERATAGQNNLYELHRDNSKWTTTFIATLSGEDSPEWEGNGQADTAFVTARVSPSGRYLAFMSAAPITGYDNVDADPAAKGARAEEVYLYDSATATLRCISCNGSGARPAGVFDTKESGEGLGLVADRRQVWVGHWLAGNIPGWTAQSLVGAMFQSRYLSDEGRLYFNSPDSLVPAARNGKENVYEYEPSGVGSCQSPSGGCVSLLSGGSSDRESAFVEATPDGSNVFFVTEARLLPQDTDTAFDVYDARECSEASPCLSPAEPAPPGCGETDACRPAQPAQQIPGPSGTAHFSGPGNLVPSAPSAKQETRAKKATKPLTRAQRLSRALRKCHYRYAHARRKRKACKRSARKHYGKTKKHSKSKESKRRVRAGR
jgi:phosphodiesterase/alkaline phosphatase D-like protein